MKSLSLVFAHATLALQNQEMALVDEGLEELAHGYAALRHLAISRGFVIS